jgi:hypothetical protein
MASTTHQPINPADIFGGPAPLVVSGFNPHHAETRATIAITGSGLLDVTHVRFQGGIDAQLTFDGDQELIVTVPDGAQTGPITVSTATQQVTTTDVFFVDPPKPEDLGATPTAAKAGDRITITGRHLATVTEVTFQASNGSFDATPMGLMPKSLTVIVPAAAAAGPAPIVVKNPAGMGRIGSFRIKR